MTKHKMNMVKMVKDAIAFSSFSHIVKPSSPRDRVGVRVYSEVMTKTVIDKIIDAGFELRNVKPVDDTQIVAFFTPRFEP